VNVFSPFHKFFGLVGLRLGLDLGILVVWKAMCVVYVFLCLVITRQSQDRQQDIQLTIQYEFNLLP
jgi:hypothetical protein